MIIIFSIKETQLRVLPHCWDVAWLTRPGFHHSGLRQYGVWQRLCCGPDRCFRLPGGTVKQQIIEIIQVDLRHPESAVTNPRWLVTKWGFTVVYVFFTHWQTGFNEDWGFIPSISPMINLSGFKFGPNLPKFRTAPLAMGSWSITMNRDGQEAIGYGGLVIYVQTGSGLRGSGLRVCLGLFGFVWGSQLKGCGLLWKLVHGYPFRFSRVFFPKSDRVWGC